MSECKHEFIGTAQGVSCKKCGLSLTAQEYGKLVNPAPKTKRAPRKRGKDDE